MKWLLIVGAVLLSLPLKAQATVPDGATSPVTAVLTSGNTTPLLGEPFSLTLSVTVANDATLDGWVTLDDPSGALEVISASDIAEQLTENTTRYTQEIQAVLWHVGVYLSPEWRLTYFANGSQFFAPVQSVSLTIPTSVTNPALNTLRASIPPVEMSYVSPLLIGALVFLFGASLIWLIQRARRRTRPAVVSVARVQDILAWLDDLKNSSLSASEILLATGDRLRLYVWQQLGINAPELTTRELMDALSLRADMPPALRVELGTLLEQADLVKFARMVPDVLPARYVNIAIRWINRVEQQLRVYNNV